MKKRILLLIAITTLFLLHTLSAQVKTNLHSTKVIEGLKGQLNGDGEFDMLKFADGTSQITGLGSAGSLLDADGDTKIQVEESADEDKVRIDTGGTERVIIDSSGFDNKGQPILNVGNVEFDGNTPSPLVAGSLWFVGNKLRYYTGETIRTIAWALSSSLVTEAGNNLVTEAGNNLTTEY